MLSSMFCSEHRRALLSGGLWKFTLLLFLTTDFAAGEGEALDD